MKCFLTKQDGTTTDISEITGHFSIQGASKECSRTLEVPFLRPYLDHYLPRIEVKLGDTIELVDEKEGSIFKGVVWTRRWGANDTEQQTTVYDKAVYLNKNDTKKQVFKNQSSATITKEICAELGLSVGELAQGGTENINGRGMKAYDIIMHTYTKASKKNKKKYKLVARGDEIVVFEIGRVHPIALEELDEALPGKLLDAEFEESLDDLVNSVEVVEVKEKDKKEAKEEKEESKKKYGVVQKIIRGEPADIEGTMADAKMEVDIECIADWDMITGMSIRLKTKDIDKEFFIISDDHEYKDGIHTAKLKLSTEFEMDTREEGETGSSKKGSASGNVESAIDWAHSQIGKPYSQAKRLSGNAYDCSSFALRYGQKAGLLPKGYNWSSASIPKSPYVTEIPREQLQRGDLLNSAGEHVAIYLGDGKVIHSTPPAVKVSDAGQYSNYKAYRFTGG